MRAQESAIDNERSVARFSKSPAVMWMVSSWLVDSRFHGQRVVAVALTAPQPPSRNTIADYRAAPREQRLLS